MLQISQKQRRQLQKLADRVEQITRADRLFFERRPERQHRVRLAGPAEIEELGILEPMLAVPAGSRVFVAVRNVGPGLRFRAKLVAPEACETDLSEHQARAIFEMAAGRFAQ